MAPRKRVLPSGVLAQLETKLEEKRRELQAERVRTVNTKLHISLLEAQMAVGTALRAAAAGTPRAEYGDAVDAAVADLATWLAAAEAATAAGGGADSSVDDAVPPPPAPADAPAPMAAEDAGSGEPSGSSGDGAGDGPSADAHGPPEVGSTRGEAAAQKSAAAAAAATVVADSGSGASAATAVNVALESVDGPAAFGGVGVTTSEFLECVHQASQLDMEREGFIEWWRDAVREVALLLYQIDPGEGPLDVLLMHLREMGARTAGLCMRHVWFFSLFNMNLATGEGDTPSMEIWERTARGMDLSPAQELTVALINQWWRAHDGALKQRRIELAEMALEAPDDAVLQAEVADETLRLLDLYKSYLMPVMVLFNVVLLRPEQLAAYFIQPWPWIPVLTPVCETFDRRWLARKQQDKAPPRRPPRR